MQVLQLWRNSPGQQCRLGADLLDSSPAEWDLGVLVHSYLSLTSGVPWGQEGQGCLGLRKSIARRLGEMILPLNSALVKPCLEHCVHICTTRYNRDMELWSTSIRVPLN